MSTRWPGDFDETELQQGDEFSGPDLEEELRLGSACNKLLLSAEYKMATAAVRDAIMDKFLSSPVRDSEGHTMCRLMVKLMDDIELMLQNTVNTGKMAAVQLDEQDRSFKEDQIS